VYLLSPRLSVSSRTRRAVDLFIPGTAMISKAQSQELSRLSRFKKHSPKSADPLGTELIEFFKHSVARRQSRLVKIAEAWAELVPEFLSDHCALESYTKGTLTVFVDSSSHLYELKQLLLAGLERQLFFGCKSSGLRKIVLKAGRWYEGHQPEKLRFNNKR
jgi:hypothetical protein